MLTSYIWHYLYFWVVSCLFFENKHCSVSVCFTSSCISLLVEYLTWPECIYNVSHLRLIVFTFACVFSVCLSLLSLLDCVVTFREFQTCVSSSSSSCFSWPQPCLFDFVSLVLYLSQLLFPVSTFCYVRPFLRHIHVYHFVRLTSFVPSLNKSRSLNSAFCLQLMNS